MPWTGPSFVLPLEIGAHYLHLTEEQVALLQPRLRKLVPRGDRLQHRYAYDYLAGHTHIDGRSGVRRHRGLVFTRLREGIMAAVQQAQIEVVEVRPSRGCPRCPSSCRSYWSWEALAQAFAGLSAGSIQHVAEGLNTMPEAARAACAIALCHCPSSDVLVRLVGSGFNPTCD